MAADSQETATESQEMAAVHVFATTDDDKVVDFFRSLFSAVIAISTFGASITFGTVVADIATPVGESTEEEVRYFLGLAFLLFLVALGTASFLAVGLSFNRKSIKIGLQSHGTRRLLWSGVTMVASGLVQGLIFAAFIFLSLALRAYTDAVGTASLICTSVFAALAFLFIIGQAIWGG